MVLKKIFMARYQGVTDFCCGFGLYDRCQFYLAAIAPFDMAAASIFRKNLALCRDDQGLVRNSLSSGLHGAGRSLSRAEAKLLLNVRTAAEDLRQHKVFSTSVEYSVDETPDACKPMAQLMAFN